MVQPSMSKIDKVIELHNKLEDEVQKLSFDIRFVQAWMKEHMRDEHGPQDPEGPA